jgi:hypothetical protein
MKRFTRRKRRFQPKGNLEIIRDISVIRLRKAQQRLGARRFVNDIRVRQMNSMDRRNSIKPSMIRSKY